MMGRNTTDQESTTEDAENTELNVKWQPTVREFPKYTG